MCLDVKVGLLEKRQDWQEQLRELFASDKQQEYVSYPIANTRDVLENEFIV